MLHYWTRWRLDRGKLASPVEQFIVELLFKLGRKKPVLAKENFTLGAGVNVPKLLNSRVSPAYAIRPAVYRTIHGQSLDAEFASRVSRLHKKWT